MWSRTWVRTTRAEAVVRGKVVVEVTGVPRSVTAIREVGACTCCMSASCSTVRISDTGRLSTRAGPRQRGRGRR